MSVLTARKSGGTVPQARNLSVERPVRTMAARRRVNGWILAIGLLIVMLIVNSPLILTFVNSLRPTPDILFSLLYDSKAPWNESQYKSEKFDKMIVEARGELDFAKRKAIYDEMQVMVSNEAGTASPVYISNVDALSDKVGGLLPNPLGGQMGYALAEYVWLAA